MRKGGLNILLLESSLYLSFMNKECQVREGDWWQWSLHFLEGSLFPPSHKSCWIKEITNVYHPGQLSYNSGTSQSRLEKWLGAWQCDCNVVVEHEEQKKKKWPPGESVCIESPTALCRGPAGGWGLLPHPQPLTLHFPCFSRYSPGNGKMKYWWMCHHAQPCCCLNIGTRNQSQFLVLKGKHGGGTLL